MVANFVLLTNLPKSFLLNNESILLLKYLLSTVLFMPRTSRRRCSGINISIQIIWLNTTSCKKFLIMPMRSKVARICIKMWGMIRSGFSVRYGIWGIRSGEIKISFIITQLTLLLLGLGKLLNSQHSKRKSERCGASSLLKSQKSTTSSTTMPSSALVLTALMLSVGLNIMEVIPLPKEIPLRKNQLLILNGLTRRGLRQRLIL